MIRKILLVACLAGACTAGCTNSLCDQSLQDSLETAALITALCARDEAACADTILADDLRRASFYCFHNDSPEYDLSARLSPQNNPAHTFPKK